MFYDINASDAGDDISHGVPCNGVKRVGEIGAVQLFFLPAPERGRAAFHRVAAPQQFKKLRLYFLDSVKPAVWPKLANDVKKPSTASSLSRSLKAMR